MPDAFIDGIHNYCDSWCEKCAYRRRCRAFSFEQQVIARADQREASDRDAGKDAPEPGAMPPPKRRRVARRHPGNPLLTMAGQYMDNVLWFLTRHKHQKIPRAIRAQHEIVAWYHMFIYVKLTRACGSLSPRRKIAGAGWRDDDANGSAKVALIGVERSLEAWSQMRDARPRLAPYAARRVADLAQIRSLIEARFPHCRLFIRPGFDTHPIDPG